MSFNIGPDYMVRYAGSRYYTWNFDGQLPDRDITGTVHGVDTATWLADRNEELNIYLASTDGAPGIILGMLTAIGIWFALFAIFVQLYGGGALFRDKKFIGIMVGLSLLTVFVSGLAGIMLIYYATERGLKKHNIEKDEKARQRGITFLAAVVVTVPAIGIAMIMLLVSRTTAPETFVIALLIVYFLIAAAIAIVMLFQRAARWLRARNPNFGR
ncbi:MAG: hypothetical protein GXO25_08615 [Euryarchaeota archaeon]|nr:hypothetical protein [Euryarchaeota archaeon]